jgi:hypothetical protein
VSNKLTDFRLYRERPPIPANNLSTISRLTPEFSRAARNTQQDEKLASRRLLERIARHIS